MDFIERVDRCAGAPAGDLPRPEASPQAQPPAGIDERTLFLNSDSGTQKGRPTGEWGEEPVIKSCSG